MQYTILGKTGLNVSRLGFGAMRLPMTGTEPSSSIDRDLAIPMIHHAFASGVTYIDTAVGYGNGNSQRVVGEALKGWRDRITVSTKNHDFGTNEKQWWALLEQSLERLQIDTIDVYNHHGVNEQSFFGEVMPRLSKWMEKARDQKLIKHIACSFHDNNAALRRIVDSGYPEVITLQYNLLDRQLADGIAYAHSKGIGVIAMGPVGGGRLGEPSEVLETLTPEIKRIPELALRFVLANSAIDIALSGMSTMSQVTENLAIADDPVTLTPENLTAIAQHLARLHKLADLYCTGCRYCLPCPAGVDIPFVFETYNRGNVYGLWESAKRSYRQRMQEHRENARVADACVECAACEIKCPQKLPVREQLKHVHRTLLKKPKQ